VIFGRVGLNSLDVFFFVEIKGANTRCCPNTS
jgi:hypothetical protein